MDFSGPETSGEQAWRATRHHGRNGWFPTRTRWILGKSQPERERHSHSHSHSHSHGHPSIMERKKISVSQVNMDEKVLVSNDELLASNELPKVAKSNQKPLPLSNSKLQASKQRKEFRNNSRWRRVGLCKKGVPLDWMKQVEIG